MIERPNHAAPSIRDLYPDFNEEELQEAERNLEQYAAVLLRIATRIASDPVALVEFRKLTDDLGRDKTGTTVEKR